MKCLCLRYFLRSDGFLLYVSILLLQGKDQVFRLIADGKGGRLWKRTLPGCLPDSLTFCQSIWLLSNWLNVCLSQLYVSMSVNVWVYMLTCITSHVCYRRFSEKLKDPQIQFAIILPYFVDSITAHLKLDIFLQPRFQCKLCVHWMSWWFQTLVSHEMFYV